MAPRGRPPKPTALKILSGNPGKRKLNPSEPRPRDLVSLAVPRGLTGEARKAWSELAPVLSRLRVLTEADAVALRLLCEQLAEYREARKILKKLGRTFSTPRGYVQVRPEVAIASNALKQARALLTEFGLTPASRSRLHLEAGAPEADPYEAFLNG